MPYVSHEELMRDAELLASMQADAMKSSTRIAGLRAELAMLRAAAGHLLSLMDAPFGSPDWLSRMDGAAAAMRELLQPLSLGLDAPVDPARRVKTPTGFKSPV